MSIQTDKEKFFFRFNPCIGSMFILDGALYTVQSVSPRLSLDKAYLAEYLEKNGNIIKVIIVAENGHPAIEAFIEVL